MLGTMGGILRAAKGPPDYKTVSSVKNQAIAGANTGLLNDFSTSGEGQNQAFNDYIARYMANQPGAEKATGQEVGSIDQFYNGAMANQLAQLRAQRGQAMTRAAQLASQQALGSLNRSKVASQGGSSSYNARMAQGALTPIQVQAALDDANQSRADLGYITQNQLGLAGRRNAMNASQAEASSGLIPQQQRLAALKDRTGVLSGITNIDQANTFYGLQQDPNVAADIFDSMDSGMGNLVGMVGSLAGSAGGGMMGMRKGGLVRGPGTATSDSIPIRVSKGEYVLPAEVVHMTGVLPLLERVRKIALKHREEREMYHHHITGLCPRDDCKPKGKAKGGLVRGYASGGMTGGGGGANMSGTFAAAQSLQDRAGRDLIPVWSTGASMIPAEGQAPAGGGGGLSRPPRTAPMPPSGVSGGNVTQGPYTNMSNWSDVPVDWQRWSNQTADYYSNPKSPGYIAPGTYE